MASLRLNDLPTATTQFNRSIATNAAPEADKAANFETAMLLNYNAKDYAKAIQFGLEKAKISPLDERGELVLTQSYYFSENYAGTEQYAQQVVAARKAAGQKPQVGVLQMLLNAQIKQNNMAGAGQTAGELAVVEPSAENWARAIDQAFPSNPTDHQLLNLYRLKRLTKSMNANDYLGAANAALKLGLPLEAKELFAEGIGAGVITQAQAGDAFGQANTMAARDQAALAEFERVAAAASTGDTDVKLGESLWVYKRFPEAEAALRRGIQKGGLADVADAQMTLGIVLLSQGNKAEALDLFRQAEASPSMQGSARIWTLYANSM
jgi:tetratricopeptide (TPR) repeat protein